MISVAAVPVGFDRVRIRGRYLVHMRGAQLYYTHDTMMHGVALVDGAALARTLVVEAEGYLWFAESDTVTLEYVGPFRVFSVGVEWEAAAPAPLLEHRETTAAEIGSAVQVAAGGHYQLPLTLAPDFSRVAVLAIATAAHDWTLGLRFSDASDVYLGVTKLPNAVGVLERQGVFDLYSDRFKVHLFNNSAALQTYRVFRRFMGAV